MSPNNPLMAKGKDKRKVRWTEPYSFHIPRYREELRRSGVFGPKFWIRPIAISACFLGLAVGYIWWRYPGAWLPIPQLVIGLFVLPPCLMVMFLVLWVVPRSVLISPERIAVSHGNTAYAIEAEKIKRVSLDCEDPTRLVLRVEYQSRRRRDKELVVGLSPKVDPNRIAECLPEGLQLQMTDRTETDEPVVSRSS